MVNAVPLATAIHFFPIVSVAKRLSRFLFFREEKQSEPHSLDHLTRKKFCQASLLRLAQFFLTVLGLTMNNTIPSSLKTESSRWQ